MTRLAQVILKSGLITEDQLSKAEERMEMTKRTLFDVLTDLEYISEGDQLDVISSYCRVPIVDISKREVETHLITIVPQSIIEKYKVFPLTMDNKHITIALCDINDMQAIDEITFATNKAVKVVLAGKSEIVRLQKQYYLADDTPEDIINNMAETEGFEASVEVCQDINDDDLFDLKEENYKTSGVIRLVNSIFNKAIEFRASDIHVEPQGHIVIIRYRIDGDLKVITKIPRSIFPAFVVRMKVLMQLDIAERRKPQDGRVSILFNNTKIDLRASFLPTYHGEKIVIRLLNPKEAKSSFSQIGIEGGDLDLIKSSIGKPQGLVLVTGPTGSGKTSTLYSCLNYLKNDTKNIVTIEDPIEYLMEGINQTQVNLAKGVNFAAGLRSILRQDPDIILIGEIRDKETAEIAIKASQTGHLVLSTLHTNNAVSSITRMENIGLKPYLIASSLDLIVAQRLVKVNCPYCTERYDPDKRLLDTFSSYLQEHYIDGFYKGKGCEYCQHNGYYGRTAIFEMLKVTEGVKELINSRATEAMILKEARKNAIRLLPEVGIEKVVKKITTIEEIAKVTCAEEEMIKRKSENDTKTFIDVSGILNGQGDANGDKETEVYANNGPGKSERRAFMRIEKRFIAKIKKNASDINIDGVDYYEMVTTRNIGAGGAVLSCGRQLPVGSVLDVEIQFIGKDKALNCRGRVLRSNPDENKVSVFRTAVVFEYIDRNDQDAINRNIVEKAGV